MYRKFNISICISNYTSYYNFLHLSSATSTSVATSSDYYPNDRETAPTHLSNVKCQGSEVKLTNCNHTLGGSGTAVFMRCNYFTGMYFFII